MNAELPGQTAGRLSAESGSLPDDLRGLIDDARGYAEAEVAYQKARVGHVAGLVPAMAILAVVAFLFAFFALGGLVVGLIFALAPWLTPWGSTAVVCLALLVGAGVCVLLARSKWREISAAFAEGIDL